MGGHVARGGQNHAAIYLTGAAFAALGAFAINPVRPIALSDSRPMKAR
jgi:hypothetical protein